MTVNMTTKTATILVIALLALERVQAAPISAAEGASVTKGSSQTNKQDAKNLEAWRELVVRVANNGQQVSDEAIGLSFLTPNNPARSHQHRIILLKPAIKTSPAGEAKESIILTFQTSANVRMSPAKDVWAHGGWTFEVDENGQLLAAEKFIGARDGKKILTQNFPEFSKEEAEKKWRKLKDFWLKNREIQIERDYNPDTDFLRDEV